ncbi:DUF3244 domain-containing protein [Bacteroides sp. UBA939]|uniref:DUF3244 domain-containing protein n=1 Tax=Bacteroides sp. UBA939 TaxID=1946092 RepID=UPI0025C6A8E7|nr:DUF3244 domain-containing protein [Bacteroides sp. UBA939]
MRKLFWLFLVSFLVSGTSAFATPNDGGIIITLEKEVMLDEELPQARSLFEPAYAFLEDNMVHVLFQKIIPAVTIRIIQESTGQVIYSNDYFSPSTVSIDVDGQEPGTYLIEIISERIHMHGEFDL